METFGSIVDHDCELCVINAPEYGWGKVRVTAKANTAVIGGQKIILRF